MASRASSKASSILNKAKPKVIVKQTQSNQEPKKLVLKQKLAELKEDRLSRKELEAKHAWGLLAGQAPSEDKSEAGKHHALAQSHHNAINILQVKPVQQASSSDNTKLVRPSLSTAGSKRGLPNVGQQWRADRSNKLIYNEGHYESSVRNTDTRPSDRFHDPGEYVEGVIFSAPTHEHHYDQRAIDPTKPDQSTSRIGIVNSKYRKFVVVSRFDRHAVALPIYTYGGNGLEYKSKKVREEHVSIRELDLKSSAAPAESSHGTLYSQFHPAFVKDAAPFFYMTDRTSVHFTSPYCHKLDTRCTISGQLHPSSTVLLQRLFRKSLSTSNTDEDKTPTKETFPDRAVASNRYSQLFAGGGSAIAGNRVPNTSFWR